jgi:DNA-binding Xre family transcriptional regulator
MTEKYVQLMEDLQYAKRELQNWKQKCSILECTPEDIQMRLKQSPKKTKI